MGGKAFAGRIGSRLTTAQLEQLRQHCLAKVVPLFPLGVTTGRYATEKTSHGDLDVICAYDGVWVSKLRGGDVGTASSDPEDESEIRAWVEEAFQKAADLASEQKKVKVEVDRKEVERWVATGKRVRALCIAVCKAMGATEWIRNWPVSSYMVPCSVLGLEVEKEAEYEPFFQVDINVVHPDSLLWTKFMSSYSHSAHLLGQLLRLICPSLVPQNASHLLLRHSPYFGLPSIEIPLTCDIEAFLAWLGPKYSVWKTTHFNLQSDFWTWLVDVPEDSLLAEAIRKMIRRRIERRGQPENSFKTFRGDPVFDFFADWVIENSRWAPLAAVEETASDDLAAAKKNDSTQDVVLPPDSSLQDDKPPNRALLDPDQPKDLSAASLAALEFWGKTSAYLAVLEERKAAAVILAEQQRQKLAARAESERRMSLREALMQQNGGDSRGLKSMSSAGDKDIGAVQLDATVGAGGDHQG